MNAYSRANRRIYAALSDPLSATHRHRLDDLLKRATTTAKTTWLAWLRQSPVKPNSRHILEQHRGASKPGRRSTCLPASSGRCTRTACSRSPAKAAR